MMNELREKIITEIKKIYDPEIPVNIYELGLIYKIEVKDDKRVIIEMTLTSPNCPVAESLPNSVKNNLAKQEFKKLELIAQKNILSQEDFQKELSNLRKEIINFQKQQVKARDDINKLRIGATNKLISQLSPILQEYAKRNSVSLILQKKNIVMGKKEIEITLVSGELPLPIYDDYSMITNRIILKKEKYNLHWWKLYKKLSPLKFDEIVDFRSSLISYFLRTKKRNIFKMNKKKNIYSQIHESFDTDKKRDFKIITDRVRNIFPSSNYAWVAPFANWPPKEWPTESYLKICDSLFNHGISKIYILGSESESARFNIFQSNFGSKVINRCGKQHILNDYGLLQKSRIFIGNDSAMMHMAALSKTPTIGLFGPTNDKIYFPEMFDHCYLVRSSESYESLISQTQNYTLNNCLMNDVSYNQVENKILKILNDQNF